jgi:hypothetical protein
MRGTSARRSPPASPGKRQSATPASKTSKSKNKPKPSKSERQFIKRAKRALASQNITPEHDLYEAAFAIYCAGADAGEQAATEASNAASDAAATAQEGQIIADQPVTNGDAAPPTESSQPAGAAQAAPAPTQPSISAIAAQMQRTQLVSTGEAAQEPNRNANVTTLGGQNVVRLAARDTPAATEPNAETQPIAADTVMVSSDDGACEAGKSAPSSANATPAHSGLTASAPSKTTEAGVVTEGPLEGLSLLKPVFDDSAPGAGLPASFTAEQRFMFSRHSNTVAARESSERGRKQVRFADDPVAPAQTSSFQAQLPSLVSAVVQELIDKGVVARGQTPAAHAATPQPTATPVPLFTNSSLPALPPGATAVYNQLIKNCKGLVTGTGSPDKIAGELDAFLSAAVNSVQACPSDISLATEHAMALVFKDKARDWLWQQHRAGVVFGSLDNIAKAFKAHFCTEVRFSKQDARVQLYRGDVKQNKGTVQEYTSKFQAVVLRAADMSVSDQVFWYLNGLTPALAERCATDVNGKPWTALDKLVEHAFGQEMALHAKSLHAARTPAQAAPIATKPKNNKKRDRAAGAATSAAGPSTPKPDNPSKKPRKFKGNPNDKSRWQPHLTIGELQRRSDNDLCYTCGEKVHGRDQECPHKSNPK